MKKILTVFSIAVFIFACNNHTDEKKINSAVKAKQITSPASDSSAEPYLFTDKNGSVYLSWIEKRGKISSLLFSVLKKESWSMPVTIASGNNWFVNWADYPVLSSDGMGNLIAHFLEKSDTAKFTYDIKLVSTSDSGATWKEPTILHDDGKKAEHGFVTILPYKDQYFVSWLDGRKTAMEGSADKHESHHGEMTVRSALINKDGTKTNDWELDGKVCDCCQTSVAVTDNGPIVIYRDRSDEEIRDISIVRFLNGQWTEPRPVFPDQWKIKGCPVNGPRADAAGNHLAIAWFTMADKVGKVNLIFSHDGGETFQKPVRIDEGKPIGRVDVVMLDEKTAMVSWMEGTEIKAVKVQADGTKDSSIMIASSSDSRSSGFPQMTKSGNRLFFAWTDSKEKKIKVSTISF